MYVKAIWSWSKACEWDRDLVQPGLGKPAAINAWYRLDWSSHHEHPPPPEPKQWKVRTGNQINQVRDFFTLMKSTESYWSLSCWGLDVLILSSVWWSKSRVCVDLSDRRKVQERSWINWYKYLECVVSLSHIWLKNPNKNRNADSSVHISKELHGSQLSSPNKKKHLWNDS